MLSVPPWYNHRMVLQDKVAVITGGSMGIGEEIAKLFAAEGAKIVITSRDAVRAEAARARIGGDRVLALACDVRHREELDRAVALTVHNFGRVDIWINNAGRGMLDSVAAMNMAECRAMFDTNLFGAIEGMQAVIPTMRAQAAGTIINISSVAGHIAVPYMAAYCATKFALNAIGKAARVELKDAGIHVMTVCPGFIKTEFADHAVHGSDRMRIGGAVRRGITADRVARAVLNGYVGRKREVVVPWRDRIGIKLYQLSPALVEGFMARTLRPADDQVAKENKSQSVARSR
jgi:short-subunit dehydrogenase